MFTEDGFREYMRLIRETPLLTAEEEADLGKAIRMGRRAEGKLEALMSPESEGDPDRAHNVREVKQAIRAADQAKRQLVEHNLRLAATMAMEYRNRGVAMMDLIQDANLALMQATDHWDADERRFQFIAESYIKGALKASCDRVIVIHVSKEMIQAGKKLKILDRVMQAALGRVPTPEEMALELRVPLHVVERILEARHLSQLPASMDKPLDEEDGSTLADLIPDQETQIPEYLVMAGMLREKVESVLATLEPAEEKVIRLRFGFEDGIAHTQEQISRVFSKELEDVRLTEAKAMRKLRHPSRSGQLVGFLN